MKRELEKLLDCAEFSVVNNIISSLATNDYRKWSKSGNPEIRNKMASEEN
jgi:hypothetical protein